MAQRIRVNVGRTSTGKYSADTTAEVSWEGDPAAAYARMEELLRYGDRLARQEIRVREALDAGHAPD